MAIHASRRWTCVALALALAAPLGGGVVACSTTQSAGTQVDDSWITTKIKSKLAADPEVAASNVDVDTNEGVVTLSGRVENEENRQEALELARETEGVKSVRDMLEVGALE
jgi:hyperosmotically inducible protein